MGIFRSQTWNSNHAAARRSPLALPGSLGDSSRALAEFGAITLEGTPGWNHTTFGWQRPLDQAESQTLKWTRTIWL